MVLVCLGWLRESAPSIGVDGPLLVSNQFSLSAAEYYSQALAISVPALDDNEPPKLLEYYHAVQSALGTRCRRDFINSTSNLGPRNFENLSESKSQRFFPKNRLMRPTLPQVKKPESRI